MDEKRLTLREMVDADIRVRLHCSDCYRDRTVPLVTLVSDRDIAANLSSRQMERRIRCSRCNGTHVIMMAPSHHVGPLKDERALRLETNVKGVRCPECRSQAVSRSGPLKRDMQKRPRTIHGMVYQYECEDCWNWWSAN